MKFDCAIIGGGIVGLATALSLTRQRPGLKLVVLEKEPDIASHQTGHNSGVIHSGIYYKPGSFKAQFTRAGNQKMREFCSEHGIAHEVCGKLIVATTAAELPLLETLYQRGLANGLEVQKLSADAVREFEPNVRCLSAIRVPSTAIVNFRDVCLAYVRLIEEQGGAVRTGAAVQAFKSTNGSCELQVETGAVETKFFINCGGLHCDRIGKKAGERPPAQIVPFRGEYYELVPEKRDLVKTLIYPVPNPNFPFLGVHFTKMIDGSVHAGPNAVLAFKREGYNKSDFSPEDLFETLRYPGFWKLARRHYRDGLLEIYRSLRKRAFVRSLQKLVPAVTDADLIPAASGVRAQALLPNGNLVDDFLIVNGRRSIHVYNAPSPAATASLEIGAAIAQQFLTVQSDN